VDKNNILLYDPTHLTDYRRHKFSFYIILCSIWHKLYVLALMSLK